MDQPWRRRWFGIDPAETTFARRGFPTGHSRAVAQLERAGGSFVEGYHAALDEPSPGPLSRALGAIDSDWRGFAYEGAGMALALLDRVTPWRRDRLATLLAGAGDAHAYMVTIGAGWAWARLGRMLARVDRELARLDPTLGPLALDGFGFHEAYFHPDRAVASQRRPSGIRGYDANAFDAGVGRSLWFVCGADPEQVAATIGRFAPDRQPDLWAGIGLSSTYACGVSGAAIDRLVDLAGEHRACMAQGAAFAAKARERAGNPVPHTAVAVERICGTSVDLAAKLCDTELAAIAPSAMPPFEAWRRSIRETFARSFAAEPR